MPLANPTLEAPVAAAAITHGMNRNAMPDISSIERVARPVEVGMSTRKRAAVVVAAMAAALTLAGGVLVAAGDHTDSVLTDAPELDR